MLVEDSYRRFALEVVSKLKPRWGMTARFVEEWVLLLNDEPEEPERRPAPKVTLGATDLEYVWHLLQDAQQDIDRLTRSLNEPRGPSYDDPPAAYHYYAVREAITRRNYWTEQLQAAGIPVPTCDLCGRVVRSLRRLMRNSDGFRICKRACGIWPVTVDDEG
jgi:hypothetical protein